MAFVFAPGVVMNPQLARFRPRCDMHSLRAKSNRWRSRHGILLENFCSCGVWKRGPSLAGGGLGRHRFITQRFHSGVRVLRKSMPRSEVVKKPDLASSVFLFYETFSWELVGLWVTQ